MSQPILVPYDEDKAVAIANIVGEHSAFAHALQELQRRRDAGELVRLYTAKSKGNDYAVVGPTSWTRETANE